ncbi:MAG: hypothetical protein WCB46_03935 [Methanoregula sp.]
MKEDNRWMLRTGIVLVTLSLALYIVLYLIFRDARIEMFSFLGNLAFIPIQVLVITLIIEKMLESREKQQRMEKLNMVIGTFFSTAGTPLLGLLVRADPCIDTLRQRLVVRDSWRKSDFAEMKEVMQEYSCGVEIDRIDLDAARDFLLKNEEFMLMLVENPMVFEHESFTDLILAISHLTEELKARDRLSGLPKDDTAHLAIDFRRVYSRLIPEWLRYMEYLQTHYPYLFNLAMRKNPFDTSASVVIGNVA